MATASIGTTSRDYTTYQSWEDFVDGTLSEEQVGECYADSAFTGDIVIDGSITTSTNRMRLSVAAGQRHDGTESGGGVVSNPSGSGTHVTLADPYSVVEWIRFTGWGGGGWGSSCIEANADDCTVRYLIVHDETANNFGNGIVVGANNLRIYRNIVYETGTPTMNDGIADYNGSRSGVVIANNTVYNLGRYGFRKNAGGTNGTYQNNVSIGCATADYFFGSAASVESYNAASDSSVSGTGSITSQTAANLFTAVSGAYDLHLKTGANAIDAGTNLGSPYDADIDADAVSGTWDMGADEVAAGGGGGSIAPQYQFMKRRRAA